MATTIATGQTVANRDRQANAMAMFSWSLSEGFSRRGRSKLRVLSGQLTSLYQKSCQVLRKKIFRFSRRANQFTSIAIPSRSEGRIMIAMNVGRVAVDAGNADSERCESVRRRRVVPTSRCWRQCTWRQLLLRAQRRQKSRSPGRARYKP